MLGEDELKAFWTMMVSGESFLPAGLPAGMCRVSQCLTPGRNIDPAVMSFSLDLPHTRIEPASPGRFTTAPPGKHASAIVLGKQNFFRQ